MKAVTLPKIPKGSLGKVYVLSDGAASELFRECSDIVKEHWPLPEEYVVPSTDDYIVIVKSGPQIWFPSSAYCERFRNVGDGSFGVSISYSHRHKSSGGGMTSGMGQGIIRFLCESEVLSKEEEVRKKYPFVTSFQFFDSALVPGTHIFVYDLKRPNGFLLPSEAKEYCGVPSSVVADLEQKTAKAYNKIADQIESALQKRGAILTRGSLADRFVI